MDKNIEDTVLLTGAGFTRNFGGFLADRMWAEIFNYPEIQSSRNIRDAMFYDFNYESIYDQVLNSHRYGPNCPQFDENEKEAIKKSVFEAYKNLDKSIRTFHESGKYDLNTLGSLFGRFAGDNDKMAFFFTLNQDIFVERAYLGNKPLRLPGPDVNEVPRRAVGRKMAYELVEEDLIILKKDIDTISIKNSLSKNEFNYIKLHGSFNWRSYDGSNAMVIGLDKESHISREPLLKCYFNIFEEVLSRQNTKLFVIGYSFRDKHVNKLIKEAVVKYGLKLFIFSSESPEQFIEKLLKMEYLAGEDNPPIRLPSEEYPLGFDIISSGLAGYYPLESREDLFTKINKPIFGNI